MDARSEIFMRWMWWGHFGGHMLAFQVHGRVMVRSTTRPIFVWPLLQERFT